MANKTFRGEKRSTKAELTKEAREIAKFVDQQECECEGIGHNCGLPDRQRECRAARAALDGSYPRDGCTECEDHGECDGASEEHCPRALGGR